MTTPPLYVFFSHTTPFQFIMTPPNYKVELYRQPLLLIIPPPLQLGSGEYWTSKFLGHTRCDDLVAAFHDGLDELEETKMIQISMDGPNMNLKLLREIQNERQKNKLSSLIDIGSCSLHSIHGAFKTGSEKSS